MKFTVVTILPELVDGALAAGVVGRARDAGTIDVTTVNPRDFTSDKHRTVDDTPYGGGPGMVMKPEPLLAAIEAARQASQGGQGRRILLSPAGAPLTQRRVRELAALEHLILVCGRYEGIDERAIESAIDEEISLGDYVLSGGELGALVVIDAVARYIPGVLGEATSADEESHSAGLLEYPHYTRPAKLGEREVPAVLQSGNHAAIAAWRRTQSIARTAARRPDLFAQFTPTKADRKLATPLVQPLRERTYVALVHHPVFDRTGKVVTTSVTNLDIHDIARSTLTYGLAGYFLITPVTAQREKAQHIASLWLDETPARPPPASGSRAGALALVRTADSIETMVAQLTEQHGLAPALVATSARTESFPGIPHLHPDQFCAEAASDPRPVILLLGTGWGLADSLIPSVSRVLAPIEGASDWNHLSVRSAAAILFDRLFGRAPGSPTVAT